MGYFVATTHAMYYLQLAEEAIAKNDTAGAKNHFDSIAAVYFGCGDTNPVPLPIYTPDSVVTTAPQVPTQITWTKDSAQKNGDRGTVYSLYNLANKRASNYGRCGSSQSGSCTTAKDAKTTSGTVTVADLNLAVADALNYGTSGPSAAAVNNIRDSINTINAQAAQRYIARVSLDANVPGNGFGGSTQRVKVASPAASEDAAAGNGLIPTACGGGLYYQAFAGKPGGAAGDNDPPPGGAGTVPAGVLPGDAYTTFSGTILAVTPTPSADYDQAPSTFGTSGGPLVNAQCGTSANSTGTVGSNTLMVGSVMNEVTVAAAASAPYKLEGVAVDGTAALAVTTGDVTAALRGQTVFDNSADFYKKKTPIGCIGRDVRFSDITVDIAGGKKMVYTFCDPSGYKGAANPDDSLATNTNLYNSNMKTATPSGGSAVPAPAGSYFATVFGTGTSAAVPDETAVITEVQAAEMSRVWDPVMSAQLTQGGMCCDALYYGEAGVGRPTIAGVGPVSEFEPPLAGGVMAAESSVGTMCPMHGSGNGYSTSTVGNVNQVNPSETLLLEGQAFYVSLAPSQYSLPLTSTTAETQTANEAKQKQCATHITSMMKMSKAVAVESSGTPPSFTGTLAESTAGTPGKFGYSY